MPDFPERVAFLEANYTSLDRRAVDHERNDAERFERSFKFVQGMKEEILGAVGGISEKFDTLEEKVSALWDDKNKREGAFGLSKVLAGTLGGVIVAALDWIIKK